MIAGSKISTSFVVDEDGSTVNSRGNSAGLGNAADLALLGAIRASAEVVLTSGKTARADSIRMPRSADLAIFSAAGVTLNLEPRDGQRLIRITSAEASSYVHALNYLSGLGYQNIQVEFGIQGLEAVIKEIDLVVISSRYPDAAQLFLRDLGISSDFHFELPDLFVAVGSGRGRGAVS